jgi:hypothetical protein
MLSHYRLCTTFGVAGKKSISGCFALTACGGGGVGAGGGGGGGLRAFPEKAVGRCGNFSGVLCALVPPCSCPAVAAAAGATAALLALPLLALPLPSPPPRSTGQLWILSISARNAFARSITGLGEASCGRGAAASRAPPAASGERCTGEACPLVSRQCMLSELLLLPASALSAVSVRLSSHLSKAKSAFPVTMSSLFQLLPKSLGAEAEGAAQATLLPGLWSAALAASALPLSPAVEANKGSRARDLGLCRWAPPLPALALGERAAAAEEVVGAVTVEAAGATLAGATVNGTCAGAASSRLLCL